MQGYGGCVSGGNRARCTQLHLLGFIEGSMTNIALFSRAIVATAGKDWEAECHRAPVAVDLDGA